MKLHPGMMEILQSKLFSCADKTTNTTLSQVQMKMATLPENCELRFAGEKWPILQCQNIFILPGVPQFFEQKITSIASFFSTSTNCTCYTSCDTGSLFSN